MPEDGPQRVQWTHISINDGPVQEIAQMPRQGPTFEDVPLELSDKLRLAAQTGQVEYDAYFTAARLVAQHYLGTDFAEHRNHPLLRFADAGSGVAGWQYIFRVIQIGEGLYDLRKQPAFTEICRRLSGRAFAPVFYEMAAMMVLVENGFQIDARAEEEILGRDFDFVARLDDLHVNVEVTAFTAENFRENAIIERLRDKSRQVPKDEPGILFCFTPEHWFDEIGEGQKRLAEAVQKFFRRSQRINYVFLGEELWLQSTDGIGKFMLNVVPHRNPSARYAVALIDDAIMRGQEAARDRFVNAMFSRMDWDIERMMGGGGPSRNIRGTREFFRWVHWALSTPSGTRDEPIPDAD